MGLGVTTVSSSLILGGWVTEVLKNDDENRGGGGVEGWVTTVFLTFLCYSLDKKCHFKKLHSGQFFLLVVVKFLNS